MLTEDDGAPTKNSKFETISYSRHGQKGSIRRVIAGGYSVGDGWKDVRYIPSSSYFLVLVGPYKDTALSMKIARMRAERMARRLFKEQTKG